MTLRKPKLLWASMAVIILLIIAMQFAGPGVTHPPATGMFTAPDSVTAIVQRACYDCHSNNTQLRWYDQVAPVRWMVATHVAEGRKHLNFSHWDSLARPAQISKLYYMVNMVEQGQMPLPGYKAVHRSAEVSAREIEVLKNYLVALSATAGKSAVHGSPSTAGDSATTPAKVSHTAPNGIPYFDDYKQWKVLASTNRFDNHTMRVIYGNDIAIRAVQENHVDPWPDGAKIAKVVWDLLPADTLGNVTPGAFNNVQFMIRDQHKYAHTDGWGYARFNTPELIPYGKSITFDLECSRCHRLAKNNGFVFDIPTKPL
jgi:hypothetical protein